MKRELMTRRLQMRQAFVIALALPLALACHGQAQARQDEVQARLDAMGEARRERGMTKRKRSRETRPHAASRTVDEAIEQSQFGDLDSWSLRSSQGPTAIRRVYMELNGELDR